MATSTLIPEFTFGDRLAKARAVAGITQDEMAEKLGQSHSTINKWEHGTQPRNLLKVVAKWAEVTGVDELWLLKGESAFTKPGSSTPWDLNDYGDRDPFADAVAEYGQPA
jgi:transcriptional regulator with XRE-family HTH domain